MGRRKENIVYHNMRMNLENEQHRRIHKILLDLNTDVHKSVNQFLIDATDSYIRKLEGKELTNEDMGRQEESIYATREDVEKAVREMKDEIMREMISILASSLLAGKVVQMPEIRTVTEVPEEKEEDAVDETMMGLASSWG